MIKGRNLAPGEVDYDENYVTYLLIGFLVMLGLFILVQIYHCISEAFTKCIFLRKEKIRTDEILSNRDELM